ncbi:homospermidine synthase [Azohydromonas sediminis]|uniref:homospermidine synthase n=1 Tax=Azohydromonas sediminis TaxID=2259674 RepID=UPI000E64BC0C|nr:saccharopine dehydrogenase C-terminal domain-containing protein [Azohydromonas sediminis]
MAFERLHRFAGRLVMVGFGSIGQGVLPLLLRHIEIAPAQITIVTPGDDGHEIAREYGVAMVDAALTPANYDAVLSPLLGAGDFLLNLSVDVSSAALIAWCQPRGVLYLDTVSEPWAGTYDGGDLPAEQRTNYAMREESLALRRAGAPTALITHGANPGLVSHFVKQALLDIARDTGVHAPTPRSREGWARLAQQLGVRVIHIAERDTQVGTRPKTVGEFVNTWSVDGFVGEGLQPAELGWGTHERHFPSDGERHWSGSQAAIYLKRPGASTRVRSWTPAAGPQHAFLITHAEAISIADYLTLGDAARPQYRPTVHYAYHPCDDAVLSVHELAGRNWRVQPRKRILKDDVVAGADVLGVLLMGHARGAYWYGSRLSIEQARAACPHNSATSLQVTVAVLAGVVWAMQHPDRGVVEPDELPHDDILAWCRPYLGEVFGVYTDWTPLADRGWLFDEDVDRDDPWQFKNFRVA